MCLVSHASPKKARKKSTLTWLARQRGARGNVLASVAKLAVTGKPAWHSPNLLQPLGPTVRRGRPPASIPRSVRLLEPISQMVAMLAGTPWRACRGQCRKASSIAAAINCGRQPCLPRKRCQVFSNACRKWPTSNVIGSAAQGWPPALTLQRSEPCSTCC